MNVYLNKIDGIADAIVSMHMSKRSWTRELEIDIKKTCGLVFDERGALLKDAPQKELEDVNEWLAILTKWGRKHITMLRFIDFSITVEGLHRGGQDDWDSHSQRFNNRIIRSSTRLSSFGNEMSDWYKDKIIPTDMAIEQLGIELPTRIQYKGKTYVKAINGYIVEDMANNADAKRGLYMLSIPSNFIFKSNLTEWAHVYKERNEHGTANPEVKLCCEAIADEIEKAIPPFNRDLFTGIAN